MKTTIIHYADVLPGSGKTFWAVKQLIKTIDLGVGVTLYVAPTHILLEQVKKDVERRLPAKKDCIFWIDSRKNQGLHLKTSNQLQLLLDGGLQLDRTPTAAVPDGSVILCTHETFLATSLSTIARKANVKLIFDEARKCVVREETFDLASSIAEIIYRDYLQLGEVGTYGFSKITLRVPNIDTQRFTSLFNTTKKTRAQGERLKDVLLGLEKNNLELYGKLYPGVSTQGTESFLLQTLVIPAHLFFGWQNVILLSAFFRNSQMYHLLERYSLDKIKKISSQNIGARTQQKIYSMTDGGKYLLELRDVTESVTSASRVAKLKERFSNLTLTYLNASVPLNMMHPKDGVLVPPDFDTAHFSQLFRAWNSAKGGAFMSLRKALLNKKQGVSYQIKGLDEVLDVLPKHKWLYTTPLQYYARAAIHLNNAWHKKQGLKPAKLPISMNVGKTGGYWETEVLPYLKEKGLDNCVVPVPFFCHGLNKFSNYDSLAFLATLNPRPATRDLFLQLCPNYNSKLDYAVDQAVQTAMRISMRNVDSNSKTLVILPDRALAELVQIFLLGLPSVVAPSSLAKIPELNPYRPSGNLSYSDKVALASHNADLKEKMKNSQTAANKRYQQKNADYLKYLRENNEYYKKMRSLLTLISRRRKQNKDFSDLVAKVEDLKPLSQEENKRLKAVYYKDKTRL